MKIEILDYVDCKTYKINAKIINIWKDEENIYSETYVDINYLLTEKNLTHEEIANINFFIYAGGHFDPRTWQNPEIEFNTLWKNWHNFVSMGVITPYDL